MLEKINSPEDVKKLTIKEKKELSGEIREFLIDKVSKNGGHLASNLGVVELTIALVSSFDFPNDRVIFDVGHQSYVYKMLTGRRKDFDTLRKYKGLRGFPYPKESKYDFFETGHSSTSISAALGFARARDIKNEKYNVVSVIGDGSISSGMSLEALNDLGYNKTKMIIILNDNGMSISSNVGGLSSYLSRISINERYLKVKNKIKHSLDDTKIGNAMSKVLARMKDGLRTFLVPSEYFEAMGLTYIGPLDGHDISLMTKVFKKAQILDGPVIIHVVTKKGLGYQKALENPDIYHAISPFDKNKGIIIEEKDTYSNAFGNAMVKIGRENKNLVAITAAMKDGVGLKKFFEEFKDRSFDVGIAEEHATTFAAGLAKENLVPVVAIYSTFLQRAFDQIVHDVCMQNLHVIFAIDRAGIVGSDGETHQGIFDVSYLSLIPNIKILSPKSTEEVEKMLKWAIKQNGPVAIRYPRGGDEFKIKPIDKIVQGKWEIVDNGQKTAIIASGRMLIKAYLAKKEYKLHSMIINACFLKPIDDKMLEFLSKKHYNILIIEDNVLNGGLTSMVSSKLMELNYKGKVMSLGFNDKFIEQGTPEELYKKENITKEEIRKKIAILEK